MFKHLTLVLCAGTLLSGCVITTDDTSTNTDSNSSANTDPGTDTSATGGTTVDEPTTAGTDTSADTTGVTTSLTTTTDATTDAPTTDAPTTEATTTEGTTGNTTGTVDPGCGWFDRQNYYACAPNGVPGLEDPDGIDPISCADGLVEGDKCSDVDGPVSSIGCCTPEGVLFFCDTEGSNTIIREDCNE
ncbi:MAG: hypothetical protein JNL82_26875 [Myxococcales bacterium]|nr:hypothetical protein [Myxococcales bacterium]